MSTAHKRVSASAKERAALLKALAQVKHQIAACESVTMPHIRSETMRQHLLAAACSLGDALAVYNDARQRVAHARVEAQARAQAR